MNYYWAERHKNKVTLITRIKATKGMIGFYHAEVEDVIYGRAKSGLKVEPGYTTTLLADQVLKGEASLFDYIFAT